jgi:hypothetical protein
MVLAVNFLRVWLCLLELSAQNLALHLTQKNICSTEKQVSGLTDRIGHTGKTPDLNNQGLSQGHLQCCSCYPWLAAWGGGGGLEGFLPLQQMGEHSLESLGWPRKRAGCALLSPHWVYLLLPAWLQALSKGSQGGRGIHGPVGFEKGI